MMTGVTIHKKILKESTRSHNNLTPVLPCHVNKWKSHSAVIIMLTIVRQFRPNSKATFYTKSHCFTYSSLKLLILKNWKSLRHLSQNIFN